MDGGILRKFICLALLMAAVFSLTARAAEKKSGDSRQKSIQFDDGLVEGLSKGKGNLGSLITKAQEKRRPHLYDRMISFDRERAETIREFRYLP